MKIIVLSTFLASGLMAAGSYLVYNASNRSIDNREPYLNRPTHYVTPQMELETVALKHITEKKFQLRSERGEPYVIASPTAKFPQFLLFIKTSCPCSIDAQPIFNSLSRRFKGKVEFLGVIDAEQSGSKSFASLYSVAFPVLADRDLSLIHAFQAKGGIYCALVARNGHLIKMWPGYSVGMLEDMNSLLSQAAGMKVSPFDPQYAPKIKTAGCAYSSVYK